MKTFLYWFLLLSLILIHFIDMEVTTHYIENQWQNETFLPMSLAIKYLGIYNAIWLSRIIIYLLFFVSHFYKESNIMLFTMFLACCLYYTSMFGWLFILGILNWPT